MTDKSPKITTQKEVIAEDAMSKKARLTIFIPASGGHGLDDAINEIRRLEDGIPRSISAAKQQLANMANISEGPLSKKAFFDRAREAIAEAEGALSKAPREHNEMLTQALDRAFLAGSLLAEEFLRDHHLSDVEREALQKKARSRGGAAKRGRVKKDTEELVRVMSELIASGKTKSNAATIAFRRGLGKNMEANRKRYDYRVSKKTEI